MIEIDLNQNEFEYDIRGLLMAFYPGEPILCGSVWKDEGAGKMRQAASARRTEQADGVPDKRLEIRYEESAIRLRLLQWGMPEQSLEQTVDVSEMNRTARKTALKCALYRMLVRQSGRELVWGTLTGIRPTKLAMAQLETGAGREDIIRHLCENYLVSEEKAALSYEIAKTERALLSRLDYERGYSLYIGIPFCPTRCLYCSFPSYPLASWEKRVDDYLDALVREMDDIAPLFSDKRLNTIYIGGGTPTTLSPAQLERLLCAVEARFDFSHLLEYTVEAGRPDSVTPEKLRVLRAHPVTRISINPQTMNEKTLRLIGRQHSAAQVRTAFAMARDAGFDNINMDLILGLPEEGCEQVAHTLCEAAAMKPDNLTVHTLALKRASRLNTDEAYRHYRYHSADSEKMMALAQRYAKEMGMSPYYLYRQKNMTGNLENTGYALPGKAGIYNILIMEEKQTILALGAGATTKAVFADGRIERAENVKDIHNYLARVDEMIARKQRLWRNGV